MQAANIHHIGDATVQVPQVRGWAGWKSTQELGLAGDLAEEWDWCIILHPDSPDTLCWSKNPRSGAFIAKLVYKTSVEDNFEGPKLWWWRALWKVRALVKSKITTLLDLSNKLLTWEFLTLVDGTGPADALCIRRRLNSCNTYLSTVHMWHRYLLVFSQNSPPKFSVFQIHFQAQSESGC